MRRWWPVAVLVVALAGAGGADAARELSFGARQVTCPRDAIPEGAEWSRVACWSYDPAAVLPALRRSDRTGERVRFDLFRDTHVAVAMEHDPGSGGWIGGGHSEPDVGVVLGDDDAISLGNVWIPAEPVFELQRLDADTYVVGAVWRYAGSDPHTPPMTAPPVVETPPPPRPRVTSPAPRPTQRPTPRATGAAPSPAVSRPARSAPPSAVPPAGATTPPVATAADGPANAAEGLPVAPVAVAVLAAAAAATGVVRARRTS